MGLPHTHKQFSLTWPTIIILNAVATCSWVSKEGANKPVKSIYSLYKIFLPGSFRLSSLIYVYAEAMWPSKHKPSENSQ